ncbi:MAG: alpha/beta hydrolase [Actinobacteria bacterium]|nr:MAG: alpha/beta hydrolase [Actinomycetota bacterium]REK41098.1 MAG: alpha/beta hydrolase [Actinomycetota bacterium]
MARGPRRRFVALLIALALAGVACDSPDTASTTEGTTPTTTTSTSDPSTTSTVITSTTSTTTNPEPAPPPAESPNGAEVLVPAGDGPFPAVVLVHGGGWIVGDPSSMASLALHLTDAGFLTVNTPYQLSLRSPGFPGAVEDVSCAVAFAANHPESSGDVTVVGHSAGAHIGALVALDASPYDDECEVADAGAPARFVGLAGPYDVDRLGPFVFPFFGVEPQENPGIWEAGNPLQLVGVNPGIEVLLIHGDEDEVVPADFSEEFAEALAVGGVDVTLEILEGVDHPGARSPSIVGELIVGWIGG